MAMTYPHPEVRVPMPTAAWKVGELPRRTGLTVRALHHYDAIGLLTPSGRSPSGHRLYELADVERLQQIQSLRLMGFPLDEVKRLLDGAALSPRRVIDLHLARLQEQIAAQSRLASVVFPTCLGPSRTTAGITRSRSRIRARRWR